MVPFQFSGIISSIGKPNSLDCPGSKGKEHDCLLKIREIVSRIPSIELVFIVPFTETTIKFQGNEQAWATAFRSSS